VAAVTRRIPLLTDWLERLGRRRVRAIMRGYRALRVSGKLGLIADVREAMTNTRFTAAGDRASALIFGAGTGSAERIVRQYLLIRVAWTPLNKALLASEGRPGTAVVHSLPAEWRRVVEQHGFRAARIRSALIWAGYVVLVWAYGVMSIGRTVVWNIRAIGRARVEPGRYAFFDKLASGNLPQPGADGRSHDIVSWYAQWSGRVADLERLCHGVAGAAPGRVNGLPVLMADPIPPLTSIAAVVRYAGWGAAASGLAAIDMLRGRWWHALLLHEAGMAALVRAHEPTELARDYLFHNSGWIYRPLWTYEAERQGSRITFYFYSTNCESFKRADGYQIQANSWQVMTWPLYLVWDEFQAQFVRRAVGDGANIRAVGSIWFGTCARELPPIPDGAVAVFDVQPWRASGYRALGLADEYYTPATSDGFLADIHREVRARGATVVLKRKRQVEHWLHPQYAATLRRLEASPGFLAVDPDISAVRVIERCALVVSMPFTSTALLAREMGKPSIYYDPHGFMQKDDRAGHGIPIVTGPDELQAWIAAQQRSDATGVGRVAAR
jgi:polysaccharide biosynthesis PFTS motif protein